MKEGWIKLHRSILEKGWFPKPEYLSVWIYLLACATHEQRDYMFDGKSIKLKPGQFVTNRNEIAAKCGIHRSKVERILKLFKIEHQIEQVSGSRSRLISIVNWKEYQSDEQICEQQVSNKRAPNKNDKNIYIGGKKKVFSKPHLHHVIEYFFERTSKQYQEPFIVAQSQKFIDYHESKGWKVGNSSMKDWKAAVRTWISNIERYNPVVKQQPAKDLSGLTFEVGEGYKLFTQ